MKKKLLLFCALMASVSGVWAGNLASGKTPVILTDGSGNNKSGNTYTEEQLKIITNGTTDESETNSLILSGTSNNDADHTDLFYIQIDETGKQIGSIDIYWTGAHSTAYNIYGTNTEPTTYSDNSSWTKLVEATGVAVSPGQLGVKHSHTSSDRTNAYKYVIFEAVTNEYGCKMEEFVVNENETSVLTSIGVDKPFVQPGETVTLTAYDQLGAAMDDIEFSVGGSSISGNTYVIPSEASAGLVTFTSDAVSASTCVLTNSTIPTASNSLYSIYPASKGTTGWIGDYENKSNPQTEFAIGAKSIKPILTLGSVFITNGDVAVGLNGSWDPADYNEIIVDVISNVDATGSLLLENYKSGDISLTAGTWGGCTIKLNEAGDAGKTIRNIRLEFNKVNGVYPDVAVANLYLVPKSGSSMEIDDADDANGFRAVRGTISSSNVNEVEALTSKVIDLRGATLDGVTEITLKDNQLLLVKADATPTDASQVSSMADALTGNTQNVIVSDGTYYWAVKPLYFVDNGSTNQPAQILINSLSQGYTVKRSFTGEKWATAYFPTTLTGNQSNANVEVYAVGEYDTTEKTLAFNKTTGSVFTGGVPYVIHVTGATDLVLSGTKDIDFGEKFNAANSTAEITNLSGYKMAGNMKTRKAGDIEGTVFGFSNSTTLQFKKASSGANITAFRAYLLGPAGSSAPAFDATFTDGNTTYVGTIKANGEVSVKGETYNLNGQRVENAQKGVYVTNGKKVIVK